MTISVMLVSIVKFEAKASGDAGAIREGSTGMLTHVAASAKRAAAQATCSTT